MRARFVLGATVLALSASACTRSSEPAALAAPASTAAAAPSASPSATPAEGPDPEADARVAEALALVAEVRQLPIRHPVPGLRLGRAEIRAEVEQMLADEAPPELVEGNTELLFALDTVSSGFDLKAALAALYGSQLAGFYDPDKKRMVLAADLGEDAERMTLYHELVHALQDQHYDLAKALDWQPEKSDVQAALHCLGEGDATSAMIDVFARALGQPVRQIPPELLRMDGLLMQASPELASIPGVVTRSLIAPYADGLAFVNALRDRGGFASVDQAWRERPLSTEHILHVDKFLAKEPVAPIADIAAPPGFSGSAYRDVMGEQSLRILFEDWVPTRRASEAASDWGGDRLAVFKDRDRRVVLWHLAFDTEAAAERAATVLARGALRAELPPSSNTAVPEAPATAPTSPAGSPPTSAANSDDTGSSRRMREFVDADVARAQMRTGRLCQERTQRGAFAIARVGRHIGVTLGPYTRTGTVVRAAGTCPQSLTWANALARQL